MAKIYCFVSLSSFSAESNFFVKVSEKRQQKIQQKDQSCVGSVEDDNKSSSHEDVAKCSSPPDSKASMFILH